MNQSNLIPCFLLAAGRGERMRPLTDTLPKPLLNIQNKSLLAGFRAAVRTCTPYMGSVEMENAGVNEIFTQHMTMLKAYREWCKNFDVVD